MNKINTYLNYVLFTVVFFTLYGGINFYIGLRGWQTVGSRITFLKPIVYWFILCFLCMSYIIARILDKYLP